MFFSGLVLRIKIQKRWTSLTDYVDFCSVLHGLQIAEYPENLPKLDLTNKEELRKYLPYSRELPSYIRTSSKSEINAILNEAKSQV